MKTVVKTYTILDLEISNVVSIYSLNQNGETKMQWKRKPPETTGTYFFSGQFYITQGVQASLTPEEISAIYQDLQAFITQENGVDYLQAYEHEDGRIVWIIDQLNQEMIESGEYLPEYNHFTMLLPEEY